MIYLFLADGCEEIEALSQADILRRAGLDVKMVGITGDVITGAHDIKVKADIMPEDVSFKNMEAVILPGGLLGTQNLEESEFVRETVIKAFNESKLVCAICAAPSILGKLGILKGKKATCYPGFEKYFIDAEYVNTGVVRDGNVITGRAMGSAYDFAIEIIKALLGEKEAQRIKDEIIY